MEIEELIKELKELRNSGDTEAAHNRADKLLIEFIDDKRVTKAFENIKKWYA